MPTRKQTSTEASARISERTRDLTYNMILAVRQFQAPDASVEEKKLALSRWLVLLGEHLHLEGVPSLVESLLRMIEKRERGEREPVLQRRKIGGSSGRSLELEELINRSLAAAKIMRRQKGNWWDAEQWVWMRVERCARQLSPKKLKSNPLAEWRKEYAEKHRRSRFFKSSKIFSLAEYRYVEQILLDSGAISCLGRDIIEKYLGMFGPTRQVPKRLRVATALLRPYVSHRNLSYAKWTPRPIPISRPLFQAHLIKGNSSYKKSAASKKLGRGANGGAVTKSRSIERRRGRSWGSG